MHFEDKETFLYKSPVERKEFRMEFWKKLLMKNGRKESTSK